MCHRSVQTGAEAPDIYSLFGRDAVHRISDLIVGHPTYVRVSASCAAGSTLAVSPASLLRVTKLINGTHGGAVLVTLTPRRGAAAVIRASRSRQAVATVRVSQSGVVETSVRVIVSGL